MEALSGRLPTDHRLDDYRIDDILGRGGFAITYKAFDTALERCVAIKEYLPQALAGR